MDSDCTYVENPCLSGSCVLGQCEATVINGENCCQNVLFEQSWSALSDLSSWALLSDSNPEDDVKWQLQSQFTQGEPFALYYGNANNWNYATGNQGNFGVIESPAITAVPGKPVWVTFDLYLANEFSSGGMPNADFDRLDVSVALDDSNEMLVWSSADLSPVWWATDDTGYPVGAKWTTVGPLLMPPNPAGNWRLRFRFETIDGSANLHVGVVIDNLAVQTECQ